MRERGVACQREAASQQRRLGEQHQPAPVPSVGKRTPQKGKGKDGCELQHPEYADKQHAVGQLVDLVRKRDTRDHRAEEGDQSADEEEPEIAVAAQGRDVHRGRQQPAKSARPRYGIVNFGNHVVTEYVGG